MQHSSQQDEHAAVDLSCLDPCDDIGLKLRNQLGGVRIAPIGAVAQMLQLLLQKKQITGGKHFIVSRGRHVASRAGKSSEYFARGAFTIPIKISGEWRRSTFCDSARDPSRILIRRRRSWLGSAHRVSFLHESHHVSWESHLGLVKFGEIHCTKTDLPPVNDRSRCRCETMVRQ